MHFVPISCSQLGQFKLFARIPHMASLDSNSSIPRSSFAQYEGLRRIEPATNGPRFPYKLRPGGRNSKTRALMASAPKREKDPKKRIVITGMGLVSAFGSDADKFYDKLLEGENGIRFIDRFDASSYSVRFAGQIREFSTKGYIDGKIDRRLDDCWKYSLVSGKMALENAHLCKKELEKVDKERIGVLVGTAMGGLTTHATGIEALVQLGIRKVSPFLIPYSITNMGSALLAIDTGFSGPTYSISTACATANYCLHAAANHIRRGEADIMLAGGTEASILPCVVGGFIACKALSERNDDPQTASRPWDKDRDGFVMGEGAGVLVNYINAHATSTQIGDLTEVTAIKNTFKDTSSIKMNGTKSMIGHCLGAASALEAIATIKAITTGWLHPTINQFNIEPDVTIDTVPNIKKQHEVHVGISNSFGFGGHNSVVAFAPFNP